ncbi:MAG: tetratricopeptide repeat protein [Gomphosphaeria aponina SAG 52.96 = DSM 107014]|uniref:Tetratricopeptide repeat protein n=1 Tax=Gomphosphaeria aponina SAG 52.96 = DSM 107014 TaxID=1521640 RepID=A0A941GVC1_9CHRO|nr:tetratricopeptide repeat protein [Gomphosphaeria aponina SAG 52.96 = DSM 107014]
MENQGKHWLDKAEMVGVVVAGVGAIAAPLTQQIALASIPLAATVALNLVNRRRLLALLTEQIGQNQRESVEQLQELIARNKTESNAIIEENKNHFVNQITAVQQGLTLDLSKSKQELQENLHKLETQQKNIEEMVGNLRDIENLSQALRVNPDSAEFYYQRGVRHQRLGDKQGAIEDFTEAIRLNSKYAEAYHNRGILSIDIGEKKRAVDDLRKAAKLYFEQGEIESYQQARELSYNVHDLRKDMDLKQLLVGGLFSSVNSN